MKSCFVIKSFCDTQEKQEILERCIDFLRENYSHKILLLDGYLPPVAILKKVDYFINHGNDIEPIEGLMRRWERVNGLPGTFNAFIADYGFTEATMLMDAAHFLNNREFEGMHVISYDADLDQLREDKLIDLHQAELENGFEACMIEVRKNYASAILFSLTVDAVVSKLKKFLGNRDSWRNCYFKYEPYVVENGYYWIFSQVKHTFSKRDYDLKDYIRRMWVPFVGIPEEVKDLVIQAGIYQTRDGSKCYVMLETSREAHDIKLKLFEESHDLNFPTTVLECDQYPSDLAFICQDFNCQAFSNQKIMEMKKSLFYEA